MWFIGVWGGAVMTSAIDLFEETTTASEDFKKNITSGKRYVDSMNMTFPLKMPTDAAITRKCPLFSDHSFKTR
jgi:hypothetical protein